MPVPRDATGEHAREETHYAALLLAHIRRSGGSSLLRPAEASDDDAGTGLSLAAPSSTTKHNDAVGTFAVRRGDELLVVPERCFLTPRDGARTSWGAALLRHASAEGTLPKTIEDPSKLFLALALLQMALSASRGHPGRTDFDGRGGGAGGVADRRRGYWHAYVRSMPGPAACRRGFPELWTEEEMQSLCGHVRCRWAARARWRQAQGRKEFRLLQECVEKTTHGERAAAADSGEADGAADGILEDSALELFQWARCMVASRTFANPVAFGRERTRRHSLDLWRRVAGLPSVAACEGADARVSAPGLARRETLDAFDVFMVPFADLANHKFDTARHEGGAELGWEYCERRRVFYFEALADVPVENFGETSSMSATPRPMRTHYGKKTMQNLLVTYGFCPPLTMLRERDMSDAIQYQVEIPWPPPRGAAGLEGVSEGTPEEGVGEATGGTWICAGLGPASAIGTQDLLEAVRSSLCTTGDKGGGGRNEGIEGLVGSELRVMKRIECLLKEHVGALGSLPAAQRLSEHPSASGAGPLAHAAAILHVELQVARALVEWVRAARALLRGAAREAGEAAEGLAGAPLGERVLKELRDYARGLRRRLNSAAQENLEPECRSDPLVDYDAMEMKLNAFLGETEDYDGPKAMFADIF